MSKNQNQVQALILIDLDFYEIFISLFIHFY